MKKKDIFVYSFYRFIKINEKTNVKKKLDKYFKNKLLRGTLLISNEGINGSISGTKEELINTIKFIKYLLKIRKLVININSINFLPFNRIKVRLKKEIVSLGKGKMNVNRLSAKLIHPSKWNKIIQMKNVKLIDVRNIYEIKIGKFKNAINPNTNSFRNFPNQIKDLKIKKEDKIAMYCTGGIRCEKASSYLKQKGFKNISQLEGGIINYLEYIKNSKTKSFWRGECFVFDNRVTIDKNLNKGKYLQCYGCRQPITLEETKSKKYIKGVSCPYCFSSRSKNQKENSINRQRQIDYANKMNIKNTFTTLKKDDL
tara:strand:+ start:2955 stop:3893 length:939 start_codon:yes stop_codon:yes gene_type:complete